MDTVFVSEAILDIAESRSVSQDYLEGALQHLVRPDTLCVVRDPKGAIG